MKFICLTRTSSNVQDGQTAEENDVELLQTNYVVLDETQLDEVSVPVQLIPRSHPQSDERSHHKYGKVFKKSKCNKISLTRLVYRGN